MTTKPSTYGQVDMLLLDELGCMELGRRGTRTTISGLG